MPTDLLGGLRLGRIQDGAAPGLIPWCKDVSVRSAPASAAAAARPAAAAGSAGSAVLKEAAVAYIDGDLAALPSCSLSLSFTTIPGVHLPFRCCFTAPAMSTELDELASDLHANPEVGYEEVRKPCPSPP